MPSAADIPLSCRTCTFYGKCFGAQRLEGLLPSAAEAGEVIAHPLSVAETTTRVLRSGTTGPCVVFLHEAGGRADRWVHNLHAVALHGFRAFALDLPGHGMATKRAGGEVSVSGHAAFLDAALAAIGADRAILVGASFGGDVAAHYASLRPGRVTSLILSASTAGLEPGPEARERLRRAVRSRSRDATRERLRRIFLSPYLATEDLVEEEFRINASPGAVEALGALADRLLTEPAADPAERARMAERLPTLLIWGAEDRILPLHLAEDALAAMRGAATLAVIPDAGHAAAFEKPGLFNRALLDFLSGTLAAPRRDGVRVIQSALG